MLVQAMIFFCPFLTNFRSVASKTNKGRVNYTVALPFTLKSILRQKEELWKLNYISPLQKL
jgi:hypothetical protein